MTREHREGKYLFEVHRASGFELPLSYSKTETLDLKECIPVYFIYILKTSLKSPLVFM